MKFRKSRIVAAAMAAITAVSAAQAMSMSASAYGNAFQFTSVPQEVCESLSHMLNHITYWQNANPYKANSTWTRTVSNGIVVGPGFQDNNISRTWQGQTLTGDIALVRSMAQDYFGTTIFMEHYPNQRYYMMQLGDQLRLKRGSQSKSVFVYELPSSSNGYKMKAVELINGKITYNVQYTVSGANVIRNGQTWAIDYFTRPIKQGDANGDGYVFGTRYADYQADVDAINEIYGNNGNVQPGHRRDVTYAAASLDNNWTIDVSDYRILLYNQLQNNQFVNDGRMHGNWYYVKRLY